MSQAQRQRAIRTRTHTQPVVGITRVGSPARVDDDELCASLARLADGIGLRQPHVGRVVAPQHNTVRTGIVRVRHATAEGKGVRMILVPIADFGGVRSVRTAEQTDEALDPVNAVRQRRPARRRDTEGNRLRTKARLQITQARCNFIERIVPFNRHPARVGSALWIGTAQRLGQPPCAVDDFGRSTPFGADGMAGRVRWPRGDLDQLAVANGVAGSTTRSAQSAETGHILRCHRGTRLHQI